MDQSVFEACYRGRQSWLHHIAYMRMAKVIVALRMLEEAGTDLSGKSILDYGFGAGTFFRYCPRDAFLFGVEQDAANTESVRGMLEERGYQHVDLQTIDIKAWETHPLLARKYDVILCSHVLEHMEAPKELVARMARCLETNGIFLGIVPINERVMNPHHVARVTEERIREWSSQPGIRLTLYRELDPLMYRLQPLFNHDSGIRHRVAQAVSLGMGLTASLLGFANWNRLGNVLAGPAFLKPTQAAFILRREDSGS